MSSKDMKKVDLTALAEDFHLKSTPEDAEELREREETTERRRHKRKWSDVMRMFTMGDLGRSAGG